ncbi:unnamed protein product [Ectocarpus sp. CCAP 1310/34]|nr:unnamed protein product [Ectocarpus sp. CCAP 1310/34]
MLQVRHVVRNGKVILVYVLASSRRRCLPTFAARAHSLNNNRPDHSNASGPVESGALTRTTSPSDDKLAKETRRRTDSPAESPTNGTSSTGSNRDSNSTSNSNRKLVAADKKSARRSVKELIAQFTKGTKVLWLDFKGSRQTKAKKRAGQVLTFQENRQLRQVGRDLAKALPVLTVFSLPIAGYLAPALGYIFPKTMLPPQFWTSPQRLRFMLEDAKKQEVSSFPKLLQHLAMMASSPRPNSSPGQLQFSATWFWKEGNLNRLSREHLLQLMKSCNTVPPFKRATARFAPKSSLVSWLTTEATSISNDDLALRKQFYDEAKARISGQEEGSKLNLTAPEVLLLCWERGLLRSQHWPDAHLRWAADGATSGSAGTAVDEPIPEAEAKAMLGSLRAYLSLYDSPSATRNLRGRSLDDSVGADYDVLSSCGTGAALPPSMVLHAPALLRITHSANGSASPLCHLRVESATR